MSSCKDFLESSEQLCYVQCSFCTTILLVSVPASSLLKMVTVRCGHCTGLLSVNMMRASFLPIHLLTSLTDDDGQKKDNMCGDHEPPEACEENSPLITSSDENEETPPVPTVVNKPPEKRQRAPSAYNRFIKEEIQRLKERQPSMSHKEAFSTAAKNWAHFPRIQYKGNGESCSRREAKMARDAEIDKVACRNFR